MKTVLIVILNKIKTGTIVIPEVKIEVCDSETVSGSGTRNTAVVCVTRTLIKTKIIEKVFIFANKSVY